MKTQGETNQIKKRKVKSKKIKIIIERSKDSYSSYAENVPGIYGQGDTVEKAKQSALKGINLLIKYNKDENVPALLKGEYEIIYKFDTESFLNFYKRIFTNAALERM